MVAKSTCAASWLNHSFAHAKEWLKFVPHRENPDVI
jgi:hypothetical protein